MLDSIFFRHRNNRLAGPEIVDFGLLSEAMLFYGETRLVCHFGMLKELIKSIGTENLITLIDEGFIKVSYIHSYEGIYTKSLPNGKQEHGVTFFAPDGDHQTWVQRAIFENIGREGRSRRLSRQLSNKMEIIGYEDGVFSRIFREDYNDMFLEQGVAKIITAILPEYELPQPFVFRAIPVNEGSVQVETNLDLEAINRIYHRTVPKSHSSVTIASILNYFVHFESDLSFAARFNSDISLTETNSVLAQISTDQLLKISDPKYEEIAQFQSTVFDQGHSIREAINSGERSFIEIIELLQEAEKFKEWLKGREPDVSLIRSYYKDVTANSWVDRLPSKTFRWVFFTGVGIGVDAAGLGGLGTLGGTAISAADSFLLDKLLKGWKPNQFIDESMSKFVKQKD